jgi:nicotinamidase-related amidase
LKSEIRNPKPDFSDSEVAGRAALLVIDVQVGLFDTKPAPFEAEAVIGRINEAIDKARQAWAPVVFIQHDGEPSENWLVPHSDGWRLHPRLRIEQADMIIRKTAGDAFYRTCLESELRSRGITTLVITGYATDFCVDSTLRNAVSRDFQVVVVADAHTTTDGPVLKAKVVRQHYNWVWANLIANQPVRVVTLSEVTFSRGAARSADRP